MNRRHRTLLNTRAFDSDDKLFLREAAYFQDEEVITHCSLNGLKPDGYCLDAVMSNASEDSHDRCEFAKHMISEGLTEGIGSFCADQLCSLRDKPSLLFLLDNRLLSINALRQIINHATST